MGSVPFSEHVQFRRALHFGIQLHPPQEPKVQRRVPVKQAAPLRGLRGGRCFHVTPHHAPQYIPAEAPAIGSHLAG